MKKDHRGAAGRGGDGPDGDDAALEKHVADALVRRGDLLPTTEAEVLAAERAGVEHEGELPPGLRTLGDRPSSTGGRRRASDAPRSTRDVHVHGAASQRVVSLDEVRRRRAERRSGWASHAGTFVLGAAAAAALLLVTRDVRSPRVPDDRPAAGPSASATSSAAPPTTRIAVPPVQECAGTCCAGSRCAAAKGELRRCASGRTCLSCDEGAAVKSAFRLRLGNLVPAKGLAAEAIPKLDLCARIAGGPWSCEAARAETTSGDAGRVLPGVVTAADLAGGIELELRARGTTQVVGRWRDAVRVGPTVLCQGAGALLADEQDGVKKDLGSLAIELAPAHWVELARAADTAPLRALRGRLGLADVDPVMVETMEPGDQRFALAVGPIDADVAERLRWALLDRGVDARVGLGADHRGAPQKLPAPTPAP